MEPEKTFIYALEDNVSRAIQEYRDKLKSKKDLKEKDKEKWKKFVRVERGKIRIAADIQNRLAIYRKNIANMDERQRAKEEHNSERLGDHMRAEGLGKPGSHWHAHAMIAGKDPRAWSLRATFAECVVGVDDSHNGCWLPSNSNYICQNPYPKAVPHSRIHRYNYYAWLGIRFMGVEEQDVMINRLNQTRRDLQNSTFPPEVMLPKGKWDEPYDNLPPAQ